MTQPPDIDSLHDSLIKATYQANDESPTATPTANQLTAFAAIRTLIELTQQVHQLTVATYEHTTELKQARLSAEQLSAEH